MIHTIFEMTVLAGAATIFAILVKHRRRMELLVFCAAMATTLCGEIVNEFITVATVYDPVFLVRLPGTRIPAFIIAGGAMTAVGLYLAAVEASRRIGLRPLWLCAPLIVLLLSFLLPLIEVAGIRVGFWRWLHPFTYSPAWFIGVWQFYFLFVALSAIIPFILSVFPRFIPPAS